MLCLHVITFLFNFSITRPLGDGVVGGEKKNLGVRNIPWKLWSAPQQHPWWELVGGDDFFFFFFYLSAQLSTPTAPLVGGEDPFFSACQLSSAPPVKKYRSQGPVYYIVVKVYSKEYSIILAVFCFIFAISTHPRYIVLKLP